MSSGKDWSKMVADDGTDGPLTMARRYLALHCAHRSRGCMVWIEIILKRRRVPDDVDCLIRAADAIKHDLKCVDEPAFECLSNAAMMLTTLADVRKMREDAPLTMADPKFGRTRRWPRTKWKHIMDPAPRAGRSTIRSWT